MKKLLSIILAILMVVTMIPMAVLPASAAENLDHNIKVEIVDWTVYDAGQVIGQFNAAKHGNAFYDVSFTQADDGTFTYSYLLALERNGGNTAWDENSISFKIDSCEEEFSQVFEKSFVSRYYIEYNIKVSRSAGHSLVQVEGKDATCTEAGYEAYEYCTDCDYTTYEEIPVSTHVDANCDYKCDYNCGYVYETLDFSDAKVLTSIDGVLYIDGVEAETNSSKSRSNIYEGKYILEGDIETSRYIWILGDATLDLNGYTWNLTDKYISVNAPLSVYDTSETETGIITSVFASQTININNAKGVFNLYSGTIENTSTSAGAVAIRAIWDDVNLYAGKVKSNSSAIYINACQDITINIDDTVIESGDGYADVRLELGSGIGITKGVVDVTDYNGASLTACVSLYDTVGKITVFKGIKDAQDAEKYQIIDVVCDKYYDTFWEKTEYDEVTGEKSIYTANNAFTQQPSADNNFTVDFNNPAATFQWYEVEEKNLGTYIVEEFRPLFSYDFKAGDVLKVSTDSEFKHVVIDTRYKYIDFREDEKTKTITFDADTTVNFYTTIVDADNPVEVNFTVLTGTKLDGETEKTLQNAECGKSYCCKATVGEKVYASDSVDIGHSLVYVDAQAPTCTEIGWEAYEYCTECDYTTYVEIPATNHKDTLVQVEGKDATCTEAGYEAYEYCTACDYTTFKEIAAAGHTYEEVVTEPTCTEAGYTTYTCACGDTYVADEVEALGHTYEEVVTDPTCTEAGYTTYTCACGDTYVADEVEATGHTDADGNNQCDNGCGYEFENDDCNHMCHKQGFMGFIWKIVKFFSKLFGTNPTCECGVAHY